MSIHDHPIQARKHPQLLALALSDGSPGRGLVFPDSRVPGDSREEAPRTFLAAALKVGLPAEWQHPSPFFSELTLYFGHLRAHELLL